MIKRMNAWGNFQKERQNYHIVSSVIYRVGVDYQQQLAAVCAKNLFFDLLLEALVSPLGRFEDFGRSDQHVDVVGGAVAAIAAAAAAAGLVEETSVTFVLRLSLLSFGLRGDRCRFFGTLLAVRG